MVDLTTIFGQDWRILSRDKLENILICALRQQDANTFNDEIWMIATIGRARLEILFGIITPPESS